MRINRTINFATELKNGRGFMAPIPTKPKKRPQPTAQHDVSAANVYDSMGRSLNTLLRRQDRTNRDQEQKSTVNRQHASQYESDLQKNKLIYRDVFPGRKYKLTLSDTTWMGGANVVTVGYTVGDTFTQIYSTAEAPEDNVFEIEIPVVPAVDTLEIRLVGAASTVRSYLEDNTSTESTWGIINRIIDELSSIATGINGLKNRIEALEDAVGIPYTGTDSLDDRVAALEDAQ